MKITRLRTEEVKHIPKELEDGVIYISREFGCAIHLCACGCGEKTVTPFTRPGKYRGPYDWTLEDGPNGVSLRPSIGNQQFACRSHYWVTDGAIIPC